MVIWSVSPEVFRTSHTSLTACATSVAASPATRTVKVHGALIQLRGLYALSSAWTDTDPSALTTRSLGAIGR